MHQRVRVDKKNWQFVIVKNQLTSAFMRLSCYWPRIPSSHCQSSLSVLRTASLSTFSITIFASFLSISFYPSYNQQSRTKIDTKIVFFSINILFPSTKRSLTKPDRKPTPATYFFSWNVKFIYHFFYENNFTMYSKYLLT